MGIFELYFLGSKIKFDTLCYLCYFSMWLPDYFLKNRTFVVLKNGLERTNAVVAWKMTASVEAIVVTHILSVVDLGLLILLNIFPLWNVPYMLCFSDLKINAKEKHYYYYWFVIQGQRIYNTHPLHHINQPWVHIFIDELFSYCKCSQNMYRLFSDNAFSCLASWVSGPGR